MVDGVKKYAPVDREFPAPPLPPHRETNSLGDYKGGHASTTGGTLTSLTSPAASRNPIRSFNP